MMKTIIAVSLCLCLLLAPSVNAQAGIVDTVIKGCSSGMTSTICKGAVSRATSLCKAPGGGGNCVSMLTDLCRVRMRVPKTLKVDGSRYFMWFDDDSSSIALQQQ